jgi:hypothetical protein
MKKNVSSVNKRNGGLLLGLALAVIVLSVPARAGFLTNGSSINESGVATITGTSLTFCNSTTEVAGQCPGTAGSTSWVVPSSATGSFCLTSSASCTGPTGIFDYQNDSVTMTNLNTGDAPVGTPLPGNGLQFVTFNPTAGLPSPAITLFLTELFAGAGNNANCSTGMGECTPTGGSVTLVNTGANTSSATIAASGLAESETGQFSLMSIVFTAQFGENYQTLLAGFGSTVPEITASYSGTFTVGAAVPEPSSVLMTLMGGGLLLIALALRNKRIRS